MKKRHTSGSPALEHPALPVLPARSRSLVQTELPIRLSQEDAPLPSDRDHQRTDASVHGLQRLLVMEPSAVSVMPGEDHVAPQAQRRSHMCP
jgi:hypothetical protein